MLHTTTTITSRYCIARVCSGVFIQSDLSLVFRAAVEFLVLTISVVTLAKDSLCAKKDVSLHVKPSINVIWLIYWRQPASQPALSFSLMWVLHIVHFNSSLFSWCGGNCDFKKHHHSYETICLSLILRIWAIVYAGWIRYTWNPTFLQHTLQTEPPWFLRPVVFSMKVHWGRTKDWNDALWSLGDQPDHITAEGVGWYGGGLYVNLFLSS